MKKLVPIPAESFARLKKEPASEWGYRFVAIKLKDGGVFDQAVESEGYIIQVKRHRNIPFAEFDIESVEVSKKPWNFRRPPKP
jgi:hypothetical protein